MEHRIQGAYTALDMGAVYKAYGRIDGVEGNSQTRARLWDSKAKRRGMRKEDNSWSRSLFLL